MEGERVKTIRWFVFPLAILSLSGCQLLGVSPQTAQPQVDEVKEYYCQGGANRDEWFCEEIQDSTTYRQIPTVESIPIGAAPEPAPPAVQVTPLQPTPTEVTPPQPQAAMPLESAPLYRSLAYVPSGETRLEDLPGHYYAVQLAAFSEKYKVEEWANTTGLDGLIGARIMANGKLFYVLILGVYETRVRAERAVESIASIPMETEPWIRSVASLRPAIRDANRALEQ